MFHCRFDGASHGSTHFQVLLSADMFFCMSVVFPASRCYLPLETETNSEARWAVQMEVWQHFFLILFEIGGVMEEEFRKAPWPSVTCYNSLSSFDGDCCVLFRHIWAPVWIWDRFQFHTQQSPSDVEQQNKTSSSGQTVPFGKSLYFVKVTISLVTSIIFKRLQINTVNSRLFLSRDMDGPVQYAPGYKTLE